MKTVIKNLALVITAVLLLALISYSWAEEKEVKRLKSITVYSYTPPSEETRYLQKIEHEGMKDPIFKFSKDGGKTWTTHDKNPAMDRSSSGGTGHALTDVFLGLGMSIANQTEFNKRYNTENPLGYFYPERLSSVQEKRKAIISLLKHYNEEIDGRAENDTPENRLKFLNKVRRSMSYAGQDDPYFDTAVQEALKKLEAAHGNIDQLPETEKSILNRELRDLEKTYTHWRSMQKALEFYSRSLDAEEATPELLKLLELYDVSTLELVRQALETKARAEAAAHSSPQQECPKK